MGQDEELRALHDTYVWEVNAAITEDRLDLVPALSDEYLAQALALLVGESPAGCGRVECVICGRTASAADRRPRPWFHRHH
jgi:hypothetical protein